MRLRRSIRNGILICLSFALLAGWLADDYFKGLERGAYDTHMHNHELLVNEDIVLITVDDYSIEKISEWPFSSDLITKTLDYVIQGKPSVITSSNMMTQYEQDMSTQVFLDLQQKINSRYDSLNDSGKNNDPLLKLLHQEMDVIIQTTQAEQIITESIARSEKIILPLQIHPVDTPPKEADIDDEIKRKFLIRNITDKDLTASAQEYRIKLPVKEIRDISASFGHINKIPDSDGIVRLEQFLWPIKDQAIASLALRTYLQHSKNKKAENYSAAAYLPQEIRNSHSGKLMLEEDVLELPSNGKLLSRFYSGQRNLLFKQFSFYDVFTESVPKNEFQNKVVLFGITAAGITPRVMVSTGQNLAPVEYTAQVTSSLLNEDWIHRDNSQRIFEVFIYLLISIYVIFIARRFKSTTNILITISTAALLMMFEFGSLEFSHWYKLVTPTVYIFWCMGLFAIINLKNREKSYAKLDAERDKNNLQLGLAFQQQGALDLAFEKFLQVTPNQHLLSPLYNLGIEYERKRQFAKAATVYEFLGNINNDHLDVANRLKQSQSMAMNGTQQMFENGSRLTSLVHSDAMLEKPRLGRYEIEHEIGRGAMSIVYIGKDPKINRSVAIKVQSFSGDDDKMIAKMRERFLTEAKTAGQLNHPDIITIYDIGEETDLIYIAMEYLTGHSLEEGIKNSDLDDNTVLDISIRMAHALEYAHNNKVIHRDIKPSNIIFDRDKNAVHLTDFGIARMQDAHLTQTGQVVGTPSYMSPEQITGKRVDNRTDLFSLGATMYQLFTGKLPFQADTMATLLYKITVESPIPFDAIRSDLPIELGRIISKLLQKEPDDRYQTALELAKALEDCKNTLNNTA